MNNYLKSAVDRFEKDNRKEYLIQPISRNDAEIFHEVLEALNKIGGKALELKDILSNYKYLKDEAVAEMLLGWNIEQGGQQEQDNKVVERERPDYRPVFVNFCGQDINVGLILTLGKEQAYDYSKNRMEYSIVLNKYLEEKYKLTNGYFRFASEAARDKALEELKLKLVDYIKFE